MTFVFCLFFFFFIFQLLLFKLLIWFVNSYTLDFLQIVCLSVYTSNFLSVIPLICYKIKIHHLVFAYVCIINQPTLFQHIFCFDLSRSSSLEAMGLVALSRLLIIRSTENIIDNNDNHVRRGYLAPVIQISRTECVKRLNDQLCIN